MTYIHLSWVEADRALALAVMREFEFLNDCRILSCSEQPANMPGSAERDAIITRADFVLIMLSRSYWRSRRARRELELALTLEARTGTRLLPLRTDDARLSGLIADKVAADFRLGFETGCGCLALVVCSVAGGSEGLPVGAATGLLSSDEIKRERRALLARNRKRLRNALKPRECAVMMPFNRLELEIVHRYFVRPVIEREFGLTWRRADSPPLPDSIFDAIFGLIRRSVVVLAELTGSNGSVLVEAGMALGMRKKLLMLTQSVADLPSDLRDRRVLPYTCTPAGCLALQAGLRAHLLALGLG